MRPILIILGIIALSALTALAQNPSGYKLELLGPPIARNVAEKSGRTVSEINVRFRITRQGKDVYDLGSDYKIYIEEDGVRVRAIDIPRPTISEDLSVVLAVDVSGSMAKLNKIEQARAAAGVFFGNLPGKAQAGLILFDHELKLVEPLTADRMHLQQLINQAKPGGGTAYLDACLAAVKMLERVSTGEKAVVVATDGVDMTSKATIEQVIATAKAANVHIYPVGIGRPGLRDQITSLLVLDKSGSMLEPANDTDRVSKLEAMKEAARRFINSMPESKQRPVRSGIVMFGDDVKVPNRLTGRKFELHEDIKALTAGGETAVYDAIYDAIATLAAENAPGKNAVIAMTDGIDNTSRRRKEEVIARAKDANVTLYVLGFGRENEIEEAALQELALQTGGEYYHAVDQKQLLEVFEKVSISLHDDGVDEATLRYLAKETGGNYYAAEDVGNLRLVLQQVTQGIQGKEFNVTFPSRIQRDDGLARGVTLKLVRISGTDGDEKLTQTVEGVYLRRGLIVAQMSPLVYLGLLAALGLLLALPVGLKQLRRDAA